MHKKGSLQHKRAVRGVLFLIPLLIGLVFFFARPIAESLIFSFSRLAFRETDVGYSLTPVGLQNYHAALFAHPEYLEKLVNSLVTMVSQVPLVVIFSFFMANILNGRFRGRLAARVILFLPVVVSSAAVMAFDAGDMLQHSMMAGGGFKDAFAPAASGVFSGELGHMLQNLGAAEDLVGAITAAVDKIYEVISFSGIQILIFLAGLQSIPSSLYECAKIEGASGWESFWKITFPMVTPLILVCAVYAVVDNFTQYNNAVMQTINTTAFSDHDFGQSAAMAWIYSAVALLFIGLIYLLFSRRVYYSDKA